MHTGTLEAVRLCEGVAARPCGSAGDPLWLAAVCSHVGMWPSPALSTWHTVHDSSSAAERGWPGFAQPCWLKLLAEGQVRCQSLLLAVQ